MNLCRNYILITILSNDHCINLLFKGPNHRHRGKIQKKKNSHIMFHCPQPETYGGVNCVDIYGWHQSVSGFMCLTEGSYGSKAVSLCQVIAFSRENRPVLRHALVLCFLISDFPPLQCKPETIHV